MRTSIACLSAAAALALAACGGATEDTERTDNTTQALLAAPAPERQQQTIDVAVLGFDMGTKDAPVRIVEMSDYGCGYCRKFHEETWPIVREQFVESGKVEWKFLPFVTGMFENSGRATLSVECALEQSADLYEVMNDRVWEEQRGWKGSDDPEPVLRELAAEAGLDMGEYDSCLAEDRRMERVAAATSLANQLGVRGTPTFFVVGYPPLQGALPTETFVNMLNLVYEDATKAAPGG